VNAYRILPGITFSGGQAETVGGQPVNLAVGASWTNFDRDLGVTGQRLDVYPYVTMPYRTSWGYAVPKLGVRYTDYSLEDQPVGQPDRTDRLLGVASFDSGLFLERRDAWLGTSFTQTLEPRLYYVYIPVREQSQIPVFDTAATSYGVTQIFSENRYAGNDRIGDANQLTLAITSRLIDPGSGAERLRVSLGERFYFQDQRVVLNETPRSATTSDVLLGVEGRLSEAWSMLGLWQYNFDTSRSERFHAGARYTPAPGRVLGATYTYTAQYTDPVGVQARLNQFDLAAQWPLNANWTLLGRWNYSLEDRKTLEGVAGVEYNAGCWVLRLVGQQLTTTTQTTTNSVYVQVELNGLARFGTSPLDLLRRSVPGYVRTNDPAVSPRDGGDIFPEY
jgi:LPS-assembly protein